MKDLTQAPNKLKPATIKSVIRLLLEGVSIRGIRRITGVSNAAVGQYTLRYGAAALEIQDERFQSLPIRKLQLDEMWTYIHGRSANIPLERRVAFGTGDIWIWTSIDPESKLMPFWLVGSRSLLTAEEFIKGLRSRVASNVELISDGFHAYIEAIDRHFLEAHHRVAYEGFDRRSNNTTNHAERMNLTLRTGLSRLRRNGNAGSRRVDALIGHMALFTLWYNFVRQHGTTRVSPAMEVGLTKSLWSFDEMVKRLASRAPHQWAATKDRDTRLTARYVFDPASSAKLARRRAREINHRPDNPLTISPGWTS